MPELIQHREGRGGTDRRNLSEENYSVILSLGVWVHESIHEIRRTGKSG